MKKIKLTEKDLTRIISKIIKEDAYDKEATGEYQKRQDRLTPGKNPEYFYNEDSLIAKMRRKEESKVLSTEDIVNTLWQIQGLLSEGSPAIALRRVTELLGKMGEDVEFSDGEYTTEV